MRDVVENGRHDGSLVFHVAEGQPTFVTITGIIRREPAGTNSDRLQDAIASITVIA